MPGGFFPWTDAELLVFARAFAGNIVASPEAYRVPPGLAEACSSAVAAYAAAYAAAQAPETRTPLRVAAKNEAREAVRVQVRALGALIKAQPEVSDALKAGLGLPVGVSRRREVPPPAEAPHVMVESVLGRVVTLRLRCEADAHRGKPPGAAGALVYAGRSASASEGPIDWQLVANVSRRRVKLAFGSSPVGDTVWLRAHWYNNRKEPGPLSHPQPVNLPAATLVPCEAKAALRAAA